MESFLNNRVVLHASNCLAVLPTLAENSVDSCVCDPPYHLASIVKRFGADNAAPAKSSGATGVYARASSGFMGKKWDGGDVAFDPETWRQVYRVLKPGAHLLAFGGTRTYHRMACAIEDAGFEIRDSIQWLYGSGFPKSLDVSKAIDKAAGADREIIRERYTARRIKPGATVVREGSYGKQDISFTACDTVPATDDARAWSGFGTALKPACEPIVLARKPLSEETVAANVLRWGTGALNIDACRVEHSTVNGGNLADNPHLRSDHKSHAHFMATEGGNREGYRPASAGRWPANVIHDGSDDVVAAFPESAGQQGLVRGTEPSECHNGVYSGPRKREGFEYTPRGDSGSAARFFYTAKADADDRLGSKHPTVKPLDLMQYLVRLVTPPRGTIIDPFAGTGTTGEAAYREGFSAVLIEREAEYQADIRRRMALVLSGPDERARESVKAKLVGKPVDAGPLFQESAAQHRWAEMWAKPYQGEAAE